MLYNKNNVRKTNDKKILHKVGKQWKVVSIALLMAIGGTAAVATHANAQSTNANANNNSANAVANVSKADFAHHLQGPVNVAPKSAAPKSANSASAQSSAITYLHTEGGQAASANADASKANVSAKSDANLVNSYVKSLNAKFPTATKVLASSAASANAAARRDNTAAHRYSAMANNKATKSAVSSVASKAGYTANDYANYVVKPGANNYSLAVSNAAGNINALKLASSLAGQLLLNNGSLANDANEAKVNSVNASVAAAIANTQNNINYSASANVNSVAGSNTSALQSATIESMYASADAREAMANANSLSGSAFSTVASYASNNSAAVSSAVNSYASASDYGAHVVSSSSNNISVSNNYRESNAFSLSGVNSLTKAANSSAYSAMNQLVSNAYALNADASLTAKDNSVIASANAAKASLATESASYTSASNSAKNALTSVDAASDAASIASVVLNSVSAGMSANSNAFISNVVSSAVNGRSALENYFNVQFPSSKAESLLAKADLVSMASAYGYNVAELKSNENGLKSVASAVRTAANGSYSVSNLSSIAGSLAKSAASALTNAGSASASFAKSTDEDATLANYYASSYSNDASSEASEASNAQSALAAFYTANADAKYASASSALTQNNGIAQSKSALAKKLGLDVYAQAPKFITITKDGLLHASADYGSANDKKLGKVEKGDQYQVNSIGIANNGAVRFNITLKNGQSGYFTDAAGYVEPTYYLATPNNRENVKALKTVRLYKDINRTQYAGKTIAKGDTLSNDVVTAVNADSNFDLGGYTVFEDLKSGEFFTSNVKCVSATPVKAANNNNNNNNQNNNKPSNPVQFF